MSHLTGEHREKPAVLLSTTAFHRAIKEMIVLEVLVVMIKDFWNSNGNSNVNTCCTLQPRPNFAPCLDHAAFKIYVDLQDGVLDMVLPVQRRCEEHDVLLKWVQYDGLSILSTSLLLQATPSSLAIG